MRGYLNAAAVGLLSVLAVSSAVVDAAEPLTLVVMDPLAAPLSCPCVEGYAQREYAVLADSLATSLGREVRVGFGESLSRGEAQAGGFSADLVIGKDSVVWADAAKAGVVVTPIARLTGLRGDTTQTGLIVVRSDDPAESVGELGGYTVYFGPAECDEKHAAARRLLSGAGVDLPAPGSCETSAACSDGAKLVVEGGAGVRAAAVISSYAQPLLEGCGTIQRGDLRVVGETDEVPFITAFVSDRVDQKTRSAVRDALLGVLREPQTLRALESLIGFVAIDDDYERLVKDAGAKATEEGAGEGPRPADNASWPGWGGPNRSGVAAWLPASLPAEPEVVWRQPLRRSGLGGVAVADGFVVMGDRDLSNEFDVWRCYDAETGRVLWTHRYPAPGHLDYDNAPRATPLLADGRAYLLGAFGHLSCVLLDGGLPLWQRDLRLEYGVAEPLVWGLCASPLLVDGRLIVAPGAETAAWVALDPTTGAERWRTPGDRHGFASPIVATLGGVRQIVACDRTSLFGLRPETGEPIWRLAPPRPGDFNVPTPAIVDGRMLAVSENNGARLYSFESGGTIDREAVVLDADLRPDTSSPVAHGGRAYCVWGDLFCFGPDGDGLRSEWIASDDALPDAGSILAGRTSDGRPRLLLIGRGGELLLVDPEAADGARVVSRASPLGGAGPNAAELLTLPALVGDRLYLRGENELVCVRLAG